MSILSVDTPAVLIDMNIVERNIKKLQDYCTQRGIALRPHIKTHKLVELARLQVAAGASGINCQKLAEAEVMAAHGLDDILITYNIVGSAKLNRLMRLSGIVSKLAVTADSAFVITGLSRVFSGSGRVLNVLVECDTGGGRCGVQSPEDAAKLARLVIESPGLEFSGLMTYPAKGAVAAVQSFMSRTVDQLRVSGISCPKVSSGGSPDMWQAHAVPIVNEYRAGTYIYNDRSLVAGNRCRWSDCALSVLTTVVSVPAPGRAIVDAGSKALSSDLLGLEGYGHVVGYPEVSVTALSEEHGHLLFPDDTLSFQVGQQLQVIPNHACVVSNLFDEVTLIRDGKVEKSVKVDARGCSN